jgi:GTP-binding protein
LLDWLFPSGRPVHVLLSKSDKLSAQAAQRTLFQLRRDLAQVYPGATAQLFSSLKRMGTAEALARIEAWVAEQKQKAPAKENLAGAKKP